MAISAGAVLCGMEGYKAISGWAEDLDQKARERFGCRKRKGYYSVPSRTTFREVLISVDPDELDQALQGWNAHKRKKIKVWLLMVKTITGDALLTQRKLAHYLVEDRSAHYVFIAKDNQPTLAQDIRLIFENREKPDYRSWP